MGEQGKDIEGMDVDLNQVTIFEGLVVKNPFSGRAAFSFKRCELLNRESLLKGKDQYR
jgi:hypothetical protein